MESGCGLNRSSVKFAGLDIAEISALPLTRINDLLRSAAQGAST
jgi:hypothetical protein